MYACARTRVCVCVFVHAHASMCLFVSYVCACLNILLCGCVGVFMWVLRVNTSLHMMRVLSVSVCQSGMSVCKSGVSELT